MDRSYINLLIRMSLGLIICVVAWVGLRDSQQPSESLALEPVANIDPAETATSADSPASPATLVADKPTESKPTTDEQSGKESEKQSDKQATQQPNQPAGTSSKQPTDKKDQKMEQATFGGGCFWCVEAVLQRLEGVEKVVSGYAGGRTKSPTYEQVCTGLTGHAEVVQITFDPAKISYTKLLEVFMKTHDPTTLNQQGHDKGTQYRSIILTHNDEQAQEAKATLQKLDASGIFSTPVVTQVEPLTVFYPGEKEHQNYYNRNKSSGYCQVVVRSKVEKLEKFFSDLMKSEAKQNTLPD